MKKPRELERIVKGFSNHWRIDILILLKKNPEMSVDEVTSNLKMNVKTASEHLRRLAIAGLVLKRYEGNCVRHKLTLRAESILKFLRILE